MKLKLTNDEKAEILPYIQSVLRGDEVPEDGMSNYHYPAGALIDAILEIDGVKKADGGDCEGFSTNGWQWDWWQRFTFEGKGFGLSGSGYHGGHAFYRDPEGEISLRKMMSRNDVFRPMHEPAQSIYDCINEGIDGRIERVWFFVRDYARKNGLSIPTMHEISRAEERGLCHMDYAAKFAYAVADLLKSG